MKEFVYNGKPQRLSKITAEYYPLFSYNAILKLIKDKEIRVDGAKVGEDVVVNGGRGHQMLRQRYAAERDLPRRKYPYRL